MVLRLFQCLGTFVTFLSLFVDVLIASLLAIRLVLDTLFPSHQLAHIQTETMPRIGKTVEPLRCLRSIVDHPPEDFAYLKRTAAIGQIEIARTRS